MINEYERKAQFGNEYARVRRREEFAGDIIGNCRSFFRPSIQRHSVRPVIMSCVRNRENFTAKLSTQ